MGRADLSRHRKTSPSDTRPIRFPSKVAWILPELARHPHVRIADAIRSIDNASTQRAQVQAVKLLGILLRDAHFDDDQKHPEELKCACTLPDSHVVPICTLAVPVLLALLFDSPEATAGLTSGALRAILICIRAGVSGLDQAVHAFTIQLATWNEQDDCVGDSKMDEVRSSEWFSSAAADVSALAAIVAEQLSRNWVLNKEECLLGSLRLICYVADLYHHTAIADQSRSIQHLAVAQAPIVEERISLAINRSVLEAACDSSMKAMQDIINFLLRLPKKIESAMAARSMKAVGRAVICCQRVLELPMAPRNCLMACSVAYVSGILLQRARDGTPECVTRVLRELVLFRLDSFPPFSQLSLLRSVMEAPAAKPALPVLLFPPKASEERTKKGESVFDLLASITTANADVHLRFLAMEALIACVRRRRPEKLSPQCRDVVLKLLYERWQEPFPRVSSQIRDAMEALVEVDGGDEEAGFFWLRMAKTLIKGNWHSKGIYAPLSVLVKHLGALRLYEAEPGCQSLAMRAAGADSRLAKPVSDWMTIFWTVLWKECLPLTARFYNLSSRDLVDSLIDEHDVSMRERTTEYMLPAYFRAVGPDNIKNSAIALLTRLNDVSQVGSDLRLRGTVYILSAARQCGIFVGSFCDRRFCSLLHDALRSGCEVLRSSALDLIVTSRVSTEPVSEEEVDLIRSYLPSALMPGSSPADCSRFRHSMRRFTERLAACRHAARGGSGGWWMRERKAKYNGIRTALFEKQRTDVLRRIAIFEHDCISLLLSSAYPGAPFARMTNALEVLLLVSKNLSCGDALHSAGRQAVAIVSGLLACLLDEWERPRRSALQVLTNLDDPVAGFEVLGKVVELQRFALPLLNSPRQKDVDSGASILRCVFRKFVLRRYADNSSSTTNGCVQQSLDFCTEHGSSSPAVLHTHMSPGLAYASSVLDSLETCAALANEDFMGSCERGLFHGHCLLLRYIIQDLPWKDLSSPSNFGGALKFVRRFLELYWRCTRIAINGVSFESFDQMHEAAQDSDNDYMDGVDRILLNKGKQIMSTSSFLSVKEICVSLGMLCHEVPFGNVAGVDDEYHGILTFEQVASAVELFHFVFTSTRHWGVIDGAAEGLQLLCERLLQTSSARLRALPSELASDCLSCALSGELYVLRRSAGIPALFAAILNAEASSHSRCHDTPLLNGVVTELLQHLQRTNMYTDETTLRDCRSHEEESVAHALNLLRSMFLNGNIASNILKYLERTAMYCINAFCSASWLIRNSAMMLFSALIRRGIGVCVERKSTAPLSSFEVAGGTSATLDGERRLRGVSAFQFFSRHPRLHPFLLQQLETVVDRFKYHDKSDHPALFPTLYLLSSLSPAAADDPTASLSMLPFRELLRKCLHWRSSYVRRVAAAACIPLIEDPSHVAKAVEEYLCAGVPTEPIEVCRESHRVVASLASHEGYLSSTGPKVSRLTQNHLHGELLAIAAILKGMNSSMSSTDKLNTVKVLAECLPSRTWIAKDGKLNPCSVTRASMLVVLGRSFALARDVRNFRAILQEDTRHAEIVIALCKNIAIQLHENEVVPYEGGMEVGLSSFLSNSAKLFALVTVSSFETGETSLDEGVRALSKLIFSSQREAMQIGMDGTVQLLRYGKEGGCIGRNYRSWTSEFPKRLRQIWERVSQVLNSSDDQELLVEALRVQTAILARMQKFGSSFEHLNEHLTTDKLVCILRMAQSHACVDVREHAIILSGQILSVVDLDEKLASIWISLIESAIYSCQTSTTRIAASTSFENSRFARLRESPQVDFLEEVSVRGFIALAHLLDDENVDVRSHVSNIVYRCKGSLGEKEAFPRDVLPSITWIYNLLSTRFSRSLSFFQHMQDLLTVPNTQVQFGKRDRLTWLIQIIVQTKSSQKTAAVHPKVRDVTDGACAKKSRRLFRPEDDCFDNEVLVRMQLVAWCYRKAILCSTPSPVSQNEKADICTELVNSLHRDLMKATMYAGNGIISGASFTSDGFRLCCRSALRLLLGIACLQASCPDDDRETLEAKSSLSDRLMQIVEELGDLLHSALLSVITGIRNLLSDSVESEQSNLQGIFFLLQV